MESELRLPVSCTTTAIAQVTVGSAGCANLPLFDRFYLGGASHSAIFPARELEFAALEAQERSGNEIQLGEVAVQQKVSKSLSIIVRVTLGPSRSGVKRKRQQVHCWRQRYSRSRDGAGAGVVRYWEPTYRPSPSGLRRNRLLIPTGGVLVQKVGGHLAAIVSKFPDYLFVQPDIHRCCVRLVTRESQFVCKLTSFGEAALQSKQFHEIDD